MLNLNHLPEVSTALPWHSQEWARVNDQFREGILPHALMIVGQQYIGKSHFALAVARRLLCSEPKEEFNCGQCHACALTGSGNHGDFLWVEPEENSRVIKIDQIRGLVRFCQKTPAYGSRKVVVINPAGNMNLNAFNALLKSLEEPATGTYLILVCHRLDGIPVTIRSRCRMLRLGRPDNLASLAWLDTYTQHRQESESLLSAAEGLPLLAQEIYLNGTVDAVTQRKRVLNALTSGRISVAEAGAHWADADIGAMLEYLIAHLQQQLTQLGPDKLNTRCGHRTFHLLDEIMRLSRALSGGVNPNKQMLMDAIFSKYSRYLDGAVGDSISR